MESGSTAYKLLTRLAQFRDAGTLTDFEVVCRERTWKVHQAVLAMHSEVMLKACDGDFKARTWLPILRMWLIGYQEAHERKLDLSTHGLPYVERLMEYVYTLDYKGEYDSDKNVDVRMYALADLFDMSYLKEAASQKFKQDIASWNVKFAKDHCALTKDTIRTTYAGPSSGMCDPLVERLVALCALSADFCGSLLELTEEIPAFGRDMVKKMGKALVKAKSVRRPDEKRYRCPSVGDWCNSTFRARIGDMEMVTCYACSSSFPKSVWESLAEEA